MTSDKSEIPEIPIDVMRIIDKITRNYESGWSKESILLAAHINNVPLEMLALWSNNNDFRRDIGFDHYCGIYLGNTSFTER